MGKLLGLSRVTITVAIVSSLSPSVTVMSPILTKGGLSSSVIVTVPCVSVRVALLALSKLRKKASVSSSKLSP